MSNRCRHLFLGKGHVTEDGCLKCPWHAALYDVSTGATVRGPQGAFKPAAGAVKLMLGESAADALGVPQIQNAGRRPMTWLLSCVSVLAFAGCATSSADSVKRQLPRSSPAGATASLASTGGQSACVAGLEALGDSPATARHQASSPAQCARAKNICRWTISNSQDRTHTTPGSFTQRPPGSCPTVQLNAVLALAAHLRLAGPHGVGVCNLLTAGPLANAQRAASLEHVSCGQAAIQPAAGSISATRRISQPLTAVVLISSSPGPQHWFGYLAFMSPRHGLGLNVQIVKPADHGWAINQIGYVF